MKTRTNSKAARTARYYSTMSRLGFTFDEADTLRRAEMTLHRWSERECNGEVERDDDGKTWSVHYAGPRVLRYRTRDTETGALRRIAETVEARNARSGDVLGYYHQTDPRGASLYILRPGDVPEGEDVSAYYSRGIAVCI